METALASESRLRICYEKTSDNELVERADLPSPRPIDRPWLQTVTVKGGTSFLAGQDASATGDIETVFHLNPDLTCLIGGRMSGKSTFLDGLRVWFDHTLPTDGVVQQDVVARAQECFLSGNPDIHIVAHGPIAPTAPPKDRWPAAFYTQRELQTSVHEQEQRRQVLYRLIPAELPDLVERDRLLKECDEQLWESASEVERRRSELTEAEESLQHVQAAREALGRFKDAGIEALTDVQGDKSKLQALQDSLELIGEPIETLDTDRPSLDLGSIKNDLVRDVLDGDDASTSIRRLSKRYRAVVRYLRGIITHIAAKTLEAIEVSEVEVARVKAEVQAELVEAGGTAEELNEFEQLATTAASFEQVLQTYARARSAYSRTLRDFAATRRERISISQKQATAMRRVAEKVLERFPERIRIRQRPNAGDESLGKWLTDFGKAGVTRWWNNRQSAGSPPVTPEIIRDALRNKRLETIGMSDQVAVTFHGAMTPERRGQLAALRNSDTHAIELKVGTGPDDYRELDRLSGGAQVSVLLSLVLESDDPSPLVIDQPEDELDKAYLFDVLLPALRRLKGRRQVIFATHDANIVVNGDADHVILLEADAEHGTIRVQGAIEQAGVKEAIVQTLDGGKEAFALRQVKYGF